MMRMSISCDYCIDVRRHDTNTVGTCRLSSVVISEYQTATTVDHAIVFSRKLLGNFGFR
jgi:hypothetical protein